MFKKYVITDSTGTWYYSGLKNKLHTWTDLILYAQTYMSIEAAQQTATKINGFVMELR